MQQRLALAHLFPFAVSPLEREEPEKHQQPLEQVPNGETVDYVIFLDKGRVLHQNTPYHS